MASCWIFRYHCFYLASILQFSHEWELILVGFILPQTSLNCTLIRWMCVHGQIGEGPLIKYWYSSVVHQKYLHLATVPSPCFRSWSAFARNLRQRPALEPKQSRRFSLSRDLSLLWCDRGRQRSRGAPLTWADFIRLTVGTAHETSHHVYRRRVLRSVCELQNQNKSSKLAALLGIKLKLKIRLATWSQIN